MKAEKAIIDIEHKVRISETQLKEKILDAKNKAIEIIQ